MGLVRHIPKSEGVSCVPSEVKHLAGWVFMVRTCRLDPALGSFR